MELKLMVDDSPGSNAFSFNCTLWNWNICKIYLLLIIPLAFNCTLWNWNHIMDIGEIYVFCLLIVPYGIETRTFRIMRFSSRSFNCTLWNWNKSQAGSWRTLARLLIVPYGIETAQIINGYSAYVAFNCTLWNWNRLHRWSQYCA